METALTILWISISTLYIIYKLDSFRNEFNLYKNKHDMELNYIKNKLNYIKDKLNKYNI